MSSFGNTMLDIGSALPVVGGVVSAIRNIGADGRQVKQQKELMDVQMQGAKEMAEINKQNQMDIWNNTNYEAQMEHLKKAGLNPALLYGKGGGGGATTGGNTVAMPTGGTAAAPDPNGQTKNLMDAAMMISNKALIDSQARKNNVEADQMEGVDKELKGTQIQSLTQGIENAKATEALTKIQTDIANIEATVAGETAQEAINYIKHESVRMGGMAKTALAQGKVDENTITQKVDLINKQLANVAADTILKQAQATTQKAIGTQEEFEAELTKLGIAKNTPWYGKLIGAFLDKVGLNPMK